MKGLILSAITLASGLAALPSQSLASHNPGVVRDYRTIRLDRYQAEDLARRMYRGALGREPEMSGFRNMTQALMDLRTEQDVFVRTWDFLYKWPEFSQHVRHEGSVRVAQDILAELGSYNSRQDVYSLADSIDRRTADRELAYLILEFIRY